MTRRWKTNEQPTHKVLHDQIILHHIMQKLTIIITAPSNWNKETSSVKPNWAWDYEIMVGEITWSPESNWLLGTNARCCIGWHHDRSSMDCRWRDRQYVATDVGEASWFHVPSVWQRQGKTWVPGVCANTNEFRADHLKQRNPERLKQTCQTTSGQMEVLHLAGN